MQSRQETRGDLGGSLPAGLSIATSFRNVAARRPGPRPRRARVVGLASLIEDKSGPRHDPAVLGLVAGEKGEFQPDVPALGHAGGLLDVVVRGLVEASGLLRHVPDVRRRALTPVTATLGRPSGFPFWR
jgi:hypothetical protein